MKGVNMKDNIKYIVVIFFFLFALFLSVFFLVADSNNESNENKKASTEASNCMSSCTVTNPSATINPTDVEVEEIVVLEATSKLYRLVESDSIKELEDELTYCKEKLYLSQSVINSATELGYKDTCDFLKVIYQDCENYQSYIDYYEQRIKELKEIKYAEYPAASYIWYYMKNQGWSDNVCAGVMGNIMQETGGRSLNIQYKHEDDLYYGMCCWRKIYHPEVVGLDLEGQCEYLVRTTESLMNTYGHLYKDGYNFEQFLASASIEEASNAFMVVYERPGDTTSQRRIDNGKKAYEYFVS
jgi:hypothetical protein